MAAVTPLGGEVDQNTVVTCTDGSRLVVKVAPAGTDEALLRWHHQLLAAIAGYPEVPAVPRILAAADGSTVVHAGPAADPRLVTVQTWLPGSTLAEVDRHSPELLHELGRAAAHLVAALPRDLPPDLVPPTHHWDVLRTPEAIASVVGAVTDPDRLGQVQRIESWFREAVQPLAAQLPSQVVHQDLNDFNVLAQRDADGFHHISGILDFGDALLTARISELAIAVGYAMLRKPDPLAVASHIIRGFHEVVPLRDDELTVLYPMAAARLCVNACTWTYRYSRGINPDYALARMRYTWPSVGRLAQLPPALAEEWFRDALADPAPPPATAVRQWLRGAAPLAPVMSPAPVDADLSDQTPAQALHATSGVASSRAAHPPAASSDSAASVAAIAGRSLTSRRDRLARRTTEAGEPATLHLGVDLHGSSSKHGSSGGGEHASSGEDGSSGEHGAGDVGGLHAPLAGVVEPPPSSGTAVLLRHEPSGCVPFWSRWTGLAAELTAGTKVAAGEPVGSATGPEPLRVALFTDYDAARLAPPAFVTPSSARAWARLSPDPSDLLGIVRAAPAHWDVTAVTSARQRHLGRSQRSYYRQPMNLTSSNDVWLYDENGLGYLDTINNVTHVGHCNEVVAAAASAQLRRLNTNSRFVYEGIARYAERLAALLPDPLEVVFFVCTGSEANDLALRIARQVTGREHLMVIDGAYHGNTTAVTGISPNRYKGPGGQGAPPTTHEVATPNRYRGPYGYDDPAAGAKYAADVAAVAQRLVADGTPPAGFIAESLLGTAGCIVHPDGYLEAAFAAARAAGALCICDEVQVGFGRLGTSFWGFGSQGVVPDIVTMGKPIGNGHPLAAVVTTRAIADAFDTGMKYFNTFGGNPVSCAIGMAVLDEIEDRGLQASARAVGARFLDALRDLQQRHPLLGDARGQGLYLGIELVRDPATKAPATAQAAYLCERLKEEGIISYPTGTFDNILKIKPPMTFTEEHVALFTATLDEILTTSW